MPGRVLFLANGFVEDAPRALPDEVRKLMVDASEVRIVAPALTSRLRWLATDFDGARLEADERLLRIVGDMRGGGVSAAGETGGAKGGEDQLQVLEDLLASFHADAIVLAVHAPGEENWREKGLAGRVRERFGLPTFAFLLDEDGNVVDDEVAST